MGFAKQQSQLAGWWGGGSPKGLRRGRGLRAAGEKRQGGLSCISGGDIMRADQPGEDQCDMRGDAEARSVAESCCGDRAASSGMLPAGVALLARCGGGGVRGGSLSLPSSFLIELAALPRAPLA